MLVIFPFPPNPLCSCDANWSGETCSEFVCDGAVSVCENGGTCLADPNNSTNFFCVCPPEVLGDRCQYKPYVGECHRVCGIVSRVCLVWYWSGRPVDSGAS